MIHVEALSKRFDTITAVQSVTFTLERDSILVVLGPSGCGKTSLLRLIAGLEQPDSGHISIADQRVSNAERMLAPNCRQLGMIFQDLALWPHLSVFANVAFALRCRGIRRPALQEQVSTALGWVDLQGYDQRFPHQLSGGEQQRLAIARALVTQPPYLLLDEPFSRLDPVLKNTLIRLLQTLKTQLRLGIVYVTHNLDEALGLADRIAVMWQGQWLNVLDRARFAAFTPQELLTWYTDTLATRSSS